MDPKRRENELKISAGDRKRACIFLRGMLKSITLLRG